MSSFASPCHPELPPVILSGAKELDAPLRVILSGAKDL